MVFPLAIAIFVMEIGRRSRSVQEMWKEMKKQVLTLSLFQIGVKKSLIVALLFYIVFSMVYPLPYILHFKSSFYEEPYLTGATLFAITLYIT